MAVVPKQAHPQEAETFCNVWNMVLQAEDSVLIPAKQQAKLAAQEYMALLA